MGLILRYKDEFGYGETTMREWVVKSIEFMKSYLREPLKIAPLAALVNLSRPPYTTLFQRVTGYAPVSYLNHLRMQRAAQFKHHGFAYQTHQRSTRLFSDQLLFPGFQENTQPLAVGAPAALWDLAALAMKRKLRQPGQTLTIQLSMHIVRITIPFFW